MTHRPIAAIAINGFEPGGTPRAYPIFEDVDPATLLVDEGYQRDSSERSLKLVRKIVACWDWAKFKSPVAVLTDAGLELIDGQHTAIAAATHPDIEKIPVMIVDVQKRTERAAAFIGHNKDRVAVTAAQLHVAAVAAGDAEAQAVARVCVEAGVTVLRAQPGGGRYQPATTVSVGAIAALIRVRGEVTAVRVLSCLARARLAPINQLHIKAADLLLNTDEYSGQITPESLVTSIQSMVLKIDAEAAVFRAAHPATPAWKAIAICWFKGRRSTTKSPQNILGNIPTSPKLLPAKKNPSTQPSSWREKEEARLARTATVEPSANEDRPRALLPPVHKGDSIINAAKKDDRPELGRWQPGNHLRRCGSCGSPFVGGRKAESCADCAYRAEEVERAV